MNHDPNCIFCKIVGGVIPCHRVFEDDVSLCFLDINPVSRGHLVFVPKEHFEFLHDMPSELAGRMLANLPGLAQRLVQKLGETGYNILQNNHAVAGQVVPHVHFHLIPREEGDGLGFRWNAGKLGGDMAKELLAKLGA